MIVEKDLCLTHGQLFAGIGGFGLAAEWAGIENVWANEIDPFCCKVLRKNFPKLEVIENDIRKQKFEPVDIISGGFPCQPFSHAGKRKGADDARYLWPEMLRVIESNKRLQDIEGKSSWVIGENVAGLKSMENGNTLDRILTDLENIGYQTETFSIPACGVGAWHRRDRIWLVANANKPGLYSKKVNTTQQHEALCIPAGSVERIASNTHSVGCNEDAIQKRPNTESYKQRSRNHIFDLSHGFVPSPKNIRGYDGIPPGLDKDRIKALGNAIVPQVAYEIFKAIKQNN